MASGNSLLSFIGETPLVRLGSSDVPTCGQVWCKLEFMNPAGSSKDRMCKAIVESMEEDGTLHPGDTLVEASCGNTAISLAMISAAKGYSLTLVMPDTVSRYRQRLLAAYGARIVLTPATNGMKGSVEKAIDLLAARDRTFMINQFDNPANPEIHRRTTAAEILRDLNRPPDVFVAGVGTGGTLTGVGEVLKARSPKSRVVAVEPAESPILSGGNPGPHRIPGIGAGFIPKVLNTAIIDDVAVVGHDDAERAVNVLAETEGIYVGLSSGAALCAALREARELPPDGIVVTMLCDSGGRYPGGLQY